MSLNLGVTEDLYVPSLRSHTHLEFLAVLRFGLSFTIHLSSYGSANFCTTGMVNLFHVFIHAGMWYKDRYQPQILHFVLVVTAKVVLTLLFIRKFECKIQKRFPDYNLAAWGISHKFEIQISPLTLTRMASDRRALNVLRNKSKKTSRQFYRCKPRVYETLMHVICMCCNNCSKPLLSYQILNLLGHSFWKIFTKNTVHRVGGKI